jgi:hypothetical protein
MSLGDSRPSIEEIIMFRNFKDILDNLKLLKENVIIALSWLEKMERRSFYILYHWHLGVLKHPRNFNSR